MGFNKFVKSFDVFGTPVSLNYNGVTMFKTWIGALCSIMLKSFLLIYSGQQLMDLILYQDPQITIVSNIEPCLV